MRCGWPLQSTFARVQVFVLTDADFAEQVEMGDYCHSHGIKFIVANTKGLFG